MLCAGALPGGLRTHQRRGRDAHRVGPAGAPPAGLDVPERARRRPAGAQVADGAARAAHAPPGVLRGRRAHGEGVACARVAGAHGVRPEPALDRERLRRLGALPQQALEGSGARVNSTEALEPGWSPGKPATRTYPADASRLFYDAAVCPGGGFWFVAVLAAAATRPGRSLRSCVC